MIPLEKLRILSLRSISIAKHASTVFPKEITFIGKFSRKEQDKVLDILNASNPTELSRLKLPQSRVKCLQNWKAKRGPFKDLSQILEVEGLGITNLEWFCQRILVDSAVNRTIKKNNLNKKQLIWPPFTAEAADVFKTVLGIHVDNTGMSWAKINKDNNYVTAWDFYSFSHLPTKILPVDNFNLAMTILNMLPPANAYIFELQATKNSKSSQTIMQSHELNSMLYALINTSMRHNIDLINSATKEVARNSIYHLRNSLSARLFKTLVGGEKVSTIETVTNLFENDKTLPYGNIAIDSSLVDQYQMVPKDSKELLGQALLLIITFMELIIIKNPQSHKAIQPGQK